MSLEMMAGCRKFVYNLSLVVALFVAAAFVQLTSGSGNDVFNSKFDRYYFVAV